MSPDAEEERWGPEGANRCFVEQLGNAFVVLRTIKGVSQADLARQAGIRPNQVSRYETGQVLPQIGQLMKLLDALDVELGDLVVTTQMLGWIDRRLEAEERGAKTFTPTSWLARALDEQAAFLERARRLVDRPIPTVGDADVPREAPS